MPILDPSDPTSKRESVSGRNVSHAKSGLFVVQRIYIEICSQIGPNNPAHRPTRLEKLFQNIYRTCAHNVGVKNASSDAIVFSMLQEFVLEDRIDFFDWLSKET